MDILFVNNNLLKVVKIKINLKYLITCTLVTRRNIGGVYLYNHLKKNTLLNYIVYL